MRSHVGGGDVPMVVTLYADYEELRSRLSRAFSEVRRLRRSVSPRRGRLRRRRECRVQESIFEMASTDATTALSEAFIVTAPKVPLSNLPPLSTAGLQLRFDFEHEEEVYARLIARANMGMHGTTMIGRFDLRFSGDPFATSGDLEAFDAILQFLDEGHVAVVEAFDQATTPVMHERWGRGGR